MGWPKTLWKIGMSRMFIKDTRVHIYDLIKNTTILPYFYFFRKTWCNSETFQPGPKFLHRIDRLWTRRSLEMVFEQSQNICYHAFRIESSIHEKPWITWRLCQICAKLSWYQSYFTYFPMLYSLNHNLRKELLSY